MGHKIIIANHKMNMTEEKYKKFFQTLCDMDIKSSNNKCIVFVPYPYLFTKHKYNPPCLIGAQNISKHISGAHTGQVSIGMLKDMDCDAILLGHRDVRRCGDTDSDINAKIKLTKNSGMFVVLCVGETKEQKNAGQTLSAIREQLSIALDGLDKQGRLVHAIAYEPIWTNEEKVTPTQNEIEKMCLYIKSLVKELTGQDVYVLYGGNIDDKNAKEILDLPHVDGVLIGANSLDAKKFASIVKGEL